MSTKSINFNVFHCQQYLPKHVRTWFYTRNRSLPPATKLGQGYVFTRVCDSVHKGVLPQCMLRYTPPGADAPPGTDTHPWEQTPPGADTCPQQTPHPSGSSACWEIRATSGRYASYWNAYLLSMVFTLAKASLASTACLTVCPFCITSPRAATTREIRA